MAGTKLSEQHWFFWINCIIYYIIDVPLYSYCIYIMHKHRDDMYFIGRHITLSMILIGGFMFMGFRASGLHFPEYTIKDGLAPYQTWFNIAVHTDWFEVIGVIALYIAIFTVSLRPWHFWYDLCWAQAIANQKWSVYNNSQTSTSFFLKYRKSFGSVKYTMKLISIYCMIMVLQSVILIGIFGSNPLLFAASYNIFYLHLAISLFLQPFLLYKSQIDCLGIKKELIVFQILWTVLCSFFTFTGITQYHLLYQWWFNIHSFLTTIVPFLFMFAAIFYPLYHIKKHQKFVENEMGHIREDSQSQSHKRSADGSFTSSWPLTWTEYVFYEHNMNVFMRYLVKEFCIENLIFILECYQLKRYHFEKYMIDQVTDIEDLGFYINFDATHIVQSEIIQDSNTLIQQLKLIYNKYISHDSELQININSDQRIEIEEYFDNFEQVNNNIDKIEAIKIFDESLKEISILLRSSYSRLKLYVINQPDFVHISNVDENHEILAVSLEMNTIGNK
eukprot:424419_1